MRPRIAGCFALFSVFFLAAVIPKNTAQSPDLARQFESPPPRFGPSCFWWWFGCPYSVKDVRESLDALRAAGLGGFRICPIYAFPQAKLPPGVENTAYLSSRYLEMIGETVRYGLETGLQPESFLGTGWPFGGPYVSPEMGAGQLKFFFADVTGPQDFSGPIPGHAEAPDRLLAVQAAEISSDGGVDLRSSLDLTDRVRDWKLEKWQVPAGRWKLMTFVGGYTGMKVKRAAPGGEGLVVDHFSRDAFELHLERNGAVQAPALRGAHAIAMDSWEVFGSNWTPTLPQEFQKRRGYSLLPNLPAIFLPTGETGKRVRYDFRLTLSDLALENCFTSLRDWAHGQGFKTRVQAHGTPADILEAYGVNDFPEAEAYGSEDRHRLNIRDRKLASSAGHLFGRHQISCESFTWLRFPLFMPTLENMKSAADAIYLDGINQVNYHGLPFSPAWAGSPGWYYYAETNVMAANPWWPYLRFLSDYLRRANFLLQQGTPVIDLAVYLPYEDVWSEAYGDWYDLAGALESHFDQGGANSIRAGLESLQAQGYSFDFINARRLKESATDGAVLRIGPMSYRAVILPAVSAIDPAVLQRLREFSMSGGLVIATDRLPETSPGLLHAEKESLLVRRLVHEIFGDDQNPRKQSVTDGPEAAANSSGKGHGLFVPSDPYQSLAPGTHPVSHLLARMIRPDLVLDPPDAQVGFVHRKVDERQIYFLANIGSREKHFRGRFRVSGLYPWLFDAESGGVTPLHLYKVGNGSTEVEFKLAPFGSAFIVFAPEPVEPVEFTDLDRILRLDGKKGEVVGASAGNGDHQVRTANTLFRASIKDLPAPLALNGPWQLRTTDGVDKRLQILTSWTEFPELESFSGTASYRCEFVIPEILAGHERLLILDLGEVRDIAEVRMNGKPAGVVWKHPFALDVTRYARTGRNQLEIRVTNRLINRMRLQPPLPPPYPTLRDRVTEPVSSGLLGPVQLRPVQVLTLSAAHNGQ
jgi:hypothetical protein